MNLVNKKVLHKNFGEGKICEWDENIFSVRFNSEIKRFVFPDAFRKHLTITDKKSSQYIEKIINKKDEENKIKREYEIREIEKRKILINLPVHESSQAAFGFVDNNKKDVLDNWTAFIGNYRSGHNRGKPRIPSRIYPNTACLLTCLEKNDSEENRMIWGVFMTKEDFFGPHCIDGIIPAHEKYRIILRDEEITSFPFWTYFDDNEFKNQRTKWGSVEVKYFPNTTMARILSDILSIKRRTKQRKLCEEFLEYYCDLNKINVSQFLK